MALNRETLKTRSLTALVFVAVMFAGLFINGVLFSLLFLIIMIGCLYEFQKLMKLIYPSSYVSKLLLSIPYIVLPILMMLRLGFSNISPTAEKTFITSGFNYSPLLPCVIIFSIWINDTMAYIVGSMIGKTPLSAISPKKTWEGTIGGAVLCVIVIALLGYFIPAARQIPVIHWIVIAALCAFFGTLGDLLESKIKRLAGVKDSGTFMPGHGGFLDRFDSLLIATIAVFIYVRLFL